MNSIVPVLVLVASVVASPAAYIVGSLPASPLLFPGTVPPPPASASIIGSTVRIQTNQSFFLTSLALYDSGTAGFNVAHTAAFYSLSGGTYTLVPGTTVNFFGTAGTATSLSGYTYRDVLLDAPVVLSGGTSLNGTTFFIGFNNVNSSGLSGSDLFLNKNASVNDPTWSATVDEGVTEGVAGVKFGSNASLVGNTFPGFFLSSNLANGPANEYGFNVLANLTAVPEVGSALMGTLLGLMGLSYRRRK